MKIFTLIKASSESAANCISVEVISWSSIVLAVKVVEGTLQMSELGVFFVKGSSGASLCRSNNVLGPGAPVRAGH